MSLQLAPPPLENPIVEDGNSIAGKPVKGLMTRAFNNWLLSLTTRLEQAAYGILPTVTVAAQTASIGTTALVASAAAGLYRVSWFFRITTAASVSSSLLVTIAGTDGGISYTQAGAAVTGNTTATVQSGSFLVRADQASPISYSTTYASVGTPMSYSLSLTVEALA